MKSKKIFQLTSRQARDQEKLDKFKQDQESRNEKILISSKLSKSKTPVRTVKISLAESNQNNCIMKTEPITKYEIESDAITLKPEYIKDFNLKESQNSSLKDLVEEQGQGQSYEEYEDKLEESKIIANEIIDKEDKIVKIQNGKPKSSRIIPQQGDFQTDYYKVIMKRLNKRMLNIEVDRKQRQEYSSFVRKSIDNEIFSKVEKPIHTENLDFNSKDNFKDGFNKNLKATSQISKPKTQRKLEPPVKSESKLFKLPISQNSNSSSQKKFHQANLRKSLEISTQIPEINRQSSIEPESTIIHKPLSASTKADNMRQSVQKRNSPTRCLSPQSFKKVIKTSPLYFMDDLKRAHRTNTRYSKTQKSSSDFLLQLHREHFDETFNSVNYLKKHHNRRVPISKISSKIFNLPGSTTNETLIHCLNNSFDSPNHSRDISFDVPFEEDETINVKVNVRPHVNTFLKAISEIFEVGIFTASHSNYANLILDFLDPLNIFFKFRLYREHCVEIEDGLFVKDLRIISNRKEKNIILVDNSVYSFFYDFENGIPIIPFTDDKEDKELLKLLEYLKELEKEKDVRILNGKSFRLSKHKEARNKEDCIRSFLGI